MKTFGHILFWVYRAISILIIIVSMVQIILFKSDLSFSLNVLMPVIIVDLLLLCVTTLVSIVRKEGLASVVQLLRSTRFRLTIWYTLILALVLLIFSGIVYEAVSKSLNDAAYTNLRSRLTQVASTYNPPTGRLSMSLSGNNPTTKSASGAVEQKLVEGDIVLLMSPPGRILQMPDGYGDQLSDLTKITAKMWTLEGGQSPYLPKQLPIGSVGSTNLQVYEFGGLQSYTITGSSYIFDQAALVNQQQQVLALLVVGVPSDVSYWLANLFSVLAMTLPLMLLLSLASGYWLAGRAMRPVQTITRAARLISETDLHRRLKLKQRDELGELAATFDRMLDRLEAAFARQRQFTADASHELRTPLSIIDLEATRALARELTAREYQQTISTIQQENRHMARLVSDLLVLARADAGHAKLRYEQVDLGEVAIDTVERLAHLAQETSMVIKVAPLPELTILGDRIYLVQLLTNIIENALKYGATTGACVEIELVSHHKQGKAWAVLRARDDGPGIAKEHLPHLFERFYRVDQSRTHSQEMAADVSDMPGERPAGNGLGLSIAQWIAQAHGGEIQVRSAPGQGAVFDIWLPVYSAENACKKDSPDTHMSHTVTEVKHKEKTHMSQRMDFRESNSEEPSSYNAGDEGTPGYYSYATGFGGMNAGQKLSGLAYTGREPSASQRLALAVVSLVLWVFTLFGLVGLAIAFHADNSAGVYILLGMMLFSGLIAVVNFIFNRK